MTKDEATLGELLDADHELWATCNKCGRGKPLDLAGLVDRLGRDVTVPSLAGRFRCSACGSRSVDLTRQAVKWK